MRGILGTWFRTDDQLRKPFEKLPMHIVQLIHSLRRGGAERVTVELCIGLSKLRHDVSVIGLIDVNQYTDDEYESVNYYSLSYATDYDWPWCIPQLARNLKTRIESLKPDVVQIHSSTAAIVAAWAGLTIPAVWVFHGYSDLTRPWSVKSWLRRQVERWAVGKLRARTVAVSGSLSSAVARHLGRPVRDVLCIANGIDLSHFSFTQRALTDAPVIGVVGTLSEVKRSDKIVEAFAMLRKRYPKSILRVAGEGPLRSKMERLIKDLQLTNSTELLGCRFDIPDILQKSHVFWQLSHSEGFCLAVAEAMATGLPVVGTNVAGIREMVIDGETGFLVPLDDIDAVAASTARILSDQRLYSSLSIHGRTHIEQHFDWKTTIMEWDALLQQTTGSYSAR